MKTRKVEWAWPGHIPRGKITVIDGDPGLGKSVITTDLAARILLSNNNHAPLEVDRGPAKPEQFSLPHSGEHREREKHFEFWIVRDCYQCLLLLSS
ncbi:MAG: AAA family ATPase [Myxococcales bacterium]|nr:AAA family ATPase [Myxococcales bacterium]